MRKFLVLFLFIFLEKLFLGFGNLEHEREVVLQRAVDGTFVHFFSNDGLAGPTSHPRLVAQQRLQHRFKGVS